MEVSPLNNSPKRKSVEISKNYSDSQIFISEDRASLPTFQDPFIGTLNIKTTKMEICEIRGKNTEEKNKSDDYSETINEMKENNKELRSKIKTMREKLLKGEEKAHEYYEMYHKLLLEHHKQQDDRNKYIKENTHLKNQMTIMSRYVAKLERKLAVKNDRMSGACEFEVQDNGWAKGLLVK